MAIAYFNNRTIKVGMLSLLVASVSLVPVLFEAYVSVFGFPFLSALIVPFVYRQYVKRPVYRWVLFYGLLIQVVAIGMAILAFFTAASVLPVAGIIFLGFAGLLALKLLVLVFPFFKSTRRFSFIIYFVGLLAIPISVLIIELWVSPGASNEFLFLKLFTYLYALPINLLFSTNIERQLAQK